MRKWRHDRDRFGDYWVIEWVPRRSLFLADGAFFCDHPNRVHRFTWTGPRPDDDQAKRVAQAYLYSVDYA